MKSAPIKLSALARRVMGLTAPPAPRKRLPNEALPPENDLWRRPVLTLADLGSSVPMRPGATVAAALPSRSPFQKEDKNA